MRGSLVALLVLACMLAPAALASHAQEVKSPIGGIAFAPQLSCAIAYDLPGEQRCDVFGPLLRADEIRVTIAGLGEVFAFSDDVSGPVAIQLGVVECALGTCAASFPVTTSTRAALYVYTTGAPGTTIDVSVHTVGVGALRN